MKRIAIIPARSGSKGLKDKNIIDLCGKPLIAYSIEAAFNTKLFDKVIVSTDSDTYAEISRRYGAEVFMRGENLSNDNATTYMVIEDILKNHMIILFFSNLLPHYVMQSILKRLLKSSKRNMISLIF